MQTDEGPSDGRLLSSGDLGSVAQLAQSCSSVSPVNLFGGPLSFSSLCLTGPLTLSHLSQIRRLELSHNCLVSLPAALCSLSALQELHVDHNGLRHLPYQLSELSNLRSVSFIKNPLPSSLARHALGQPVARLLARIRRTEMGRAQALTILLIRKFRPGSLWDLVAVDLVRLIARQLCFGPLQKKRARQ